MTNAFGKLFGETKDVTQPTATQTLPSFGLGAFKQAIEQGRAAATPETFSPADLTPQQLQAIGGLEGLAAPETAESFQGRLDVFQNPFEQQVIQNTIRDLNTQAQGLQSDIGSQASAAGGFGGQRQALLESELQRNLLQQIGDVSAQTRARGFETATESALRQREQERQNLLDLLGTGGAIQQFETERRLAPAKSAQFLGELASLIPVGGGQTSPFEEPGVLNRFGDVAEQGSRTFSNIGSGIGGGSSAAGGASSASGFMALSDERLKENITKTGENNGFNIYQFNYKGDDRRYEGVMAQEVRKTNPGAVFECNGHLGVHYDMIGIPFKEVA